MDGNTEIAEAWKEYKEKDYIINGIINKANWCMAPIGLLLNVTFLYVVVRVRSMRTVINVYLGNLVVADSIYITVNFIWSTGPIDSSVCKFVLESISISSTMASFFIITALAFERFCAVCHPLRHRAESSKAQAAKRLAKLWTLAAITGSAYRSVVHWGGDIGLNIGCAMILSVSTACLLIIAVLYACVIKKLRQQPQLTSTHDDNYRLRRVVVMLIVNTALFFTFNTAQIAHVIMTLVIRWSNLSTLSKIQQLHSSNVIRVVGVILQLISSSVDPLVYSGINSEYREAFMEAFPCFHPRRCCHCFRRYQDTPEQPPEQMRLHVQETLRSQDTRELPEEQIKLRLNHQDQDVCLQPTDQVEDTSNGSQDTPHQLEEEEVINQDQHVPQEPTDQVEVHIHQSQDAPWQLEEETEQQGIHHGQQIPPQQTYQVEVHIHHRQEKPHQPEDQSELQEIKQGQDACCQDTDQVEIHIHQSLDTSGQLDEQTEQQEIL